MITLVSYIYDICLKIAFSLFILFLVSIIRFFFQHGHHFLVSFWSQNNAITSVALLLDFDRHIWDVICSPGHESNWWINARFCQFWRKFLHITFNNNFKIL